MVYTNFTDAWNAWLARLPDYDYRLSRWSTQILAWSNATTLFALRDAGNLLFVNLFNQISDHTDYNFTQDYRQSGHYMATWFANTSGAEVDMDAILSAMLSASYEQLQKFIGIEDAYRSAIWEQPFNSEFYAALARGFMP